jgi:Holliday junction resolvase RusA-like endonuclease
MKFIFTKPPTTNHIYGITARGGFAKMYISKEGKDWFLETEQAIKKQRTRKTPIDSECEIWITVYTSTRRDADGSVKPILDSLQKFGVIENDYLFFGVHALREKCKKGEDRVEIEILGYS